MFPHSINLNFDNTYFRNLTWRNHIIRQMINTFKNGFKRMERNVKKENYLKLEDLKSKYNSKI